MTRRFQPPRRESSPIDPAPVRPPAGLFQSGAGTHDDESADERRGLVASPGPAQRPAPMARPLALARTSDSVTGAVLRGAATAMPLAALHHRHAPTLTPFHTAGLSDMSAITAISRQAEELRRLRAITNMNHLAAPADELEVMVKRRRTKTLPFV